jgi:hypothetical protein
MLLIIAPLDQVHLYQFYFIFSAKTYPILQIFFVRQDFKTLLLVNDLINMYLSFSCFVTFLSIIAKNF